MKPLPTATLTEEDWRVWLHARRHVAELGWLEMIDAYEAADRRDADLMLHAQRHKLVAALLRTDDGSRIDVRLGAGIHVGHLGLTLPAR